MLLRQLYICYDLGGISMGRSHRSLLLEMAKFLIGKDRLKDINRDRCCWEFVNEAKSRISKCRNRKIRLFKKLGLVKNYSLAYLLIKKLLVWVKSAKAKQESYPTPVEKEILEAVLKLMEAEGAGVSGFFYARDLLNEASERKHRIFKMDYTRRFNKDVRRRLA